VVRANIILGRQHLFSPQIELFISLAGKYDILQQKHPFWIEFKSAFTEMLAKEKTGPAVSSIAAADRGEKCFL
jgi:hypothetical protein